MGQWAVRSLPANEHLADLRSRFCPGSEIGRNFIIGPHAGAKGPCALLLWLKLVDDYLAGQLLVGFVVI